MKTDRERRNKKKTQKDSERKKEEKEERRDVLRSLTLTITDPNVGDTDSIVTFEVSSSAVCGMKNM